MDDDLVAKYAAEAKAAMEAEAARRVAESTDSEEEERLRNASLHDLTETEHFVPALLARLGAVRAALDGHGGGIAVSQIEDHEGSLDLVLDLTGACLSCGAAPGTLEGVKGDLEADIEVHRIRFSSALLDTFDDLGREFILAHGKVEFVDIPTDPESA
jgi:Fe-S cluster biogenesis protein NfuA